MSNGKYTLEDVSYRINREGIGYALTDYIDVDKIDDEDFARLCREAKKSIEAVEGYLDENLGDWRC